MLRWTPPRWVAWLVAWLVSFAQADAEINARKATRWMRDQSARGARLLELCLVCHRLVGGGYLGVLFVAFAALVLDNEDDRRVPAALHAQMRAPSAHAASRKGKRVSDATLDHYCACFSPALSS